MWFKLLKIKKISHQKYRYFIYYTKHAYFNLNALHFSRFNSIWIKVRPHATASVRGIRQGGIESRGYRIIHSLLRTTLPRVITFRNGQLYQCPGLRLNRYNYIIREVSQYGMQQLEGACVNCNCSATTTCIMQLVISL